MIVIDGNNIVTVIIIIIIIIEYFFYKYLFSGLVTVAICFFWVFWTYFHGGKMNALMKVQRGHTLSGHRGNTLRTITVPCGQICASAK